MSDQPAAAAPATGERQTITPPTVQPEPASGHAPPAAAKSQNSGSLRKLVLIAATLAVVIAAGVWYIRSLAYVSTDDAYVNGHVTLVAPRVAGQVAEVLVDDNNRVTKGSVLVRLDREPLQVQLDIAEAALDAAKADSNAAVAEARAQTAQARTMRFALEHAIEDVDNQVALLKSKVATLNSMKATQERAKREFDRIEGLVKSNASTQQQLDLAQEGIKVADAKVEESLQAIYQVRVSLGLPAQPAEGQELTDTPADLDQTFSSVRQAQAALIEAASQLGITDSYNKGPRQMVADFYKRDPSGDIDKIYAELVKNAPGIKQADAKLLQAQRQVDLAKLNLKYTDVVAEIDGVVTRRNVNPGNNVVVGQNLMAIRSLTEIWVDANFKETQISELRIGQPVELDVDMYGSQQKFEGRVSGFTMGTGSTLALLPAQNATGNFVKVVQRLPVRIDILDYDPEKAPLFIGLSVEPKVKIREKPTGPNAGGMLQPLSELPKAPLP